MFARHPTYPLNEKNWFRIATILAAIFLISLFLFSSVPVKVLWDRGSIEDPVPKDGSELRSHQATFRAQAVEAQ